MAVENERGEVESVSVGLEVSSELAVPRELHHNPDWRLAADANQLDDVLVVELLHDVRLLQELLCHGGVSLHLAGLDSDCRCL